MAIEEDLDLIAVDLIKAFNQFKKLRVDESHFNAAHGCQEPFLKHSEIMLMFAVKEMNQNNPDGINASDLSAHIGVKSPTITPIISNLEKYEMLKREIDSADRRNIRLKLTEKGEEYTDRAAKDLVKRVKGLVNYLGEDKSKQLTELFQELYTYMSNYSNREKPTN
jgi:Transcriptional regulators